MLPFAVLESDLLAFTPVGSATCTDPCQGDLIFGPETFEQGKGKPVTEARTLNLAWDGDICLTVTNNGCSSATISLDGATVFGPNAFKPKVVDLSETVALLTGDHELGVTVKSKPGCGLDVALRACDPTPPPPRCHDVAKDWCDAKGWSVELSFDGEIVCVAPGYTFSDNCKGCEYWSLVVWKDDTRDPLCPGQAVTTYAGNYYGGHDPCECGNNLIYCDTWDMQGCVSGP